ncbi:MAG TPA: hypothetical protein VGX91_08965 [Candidatus Cybelea sp.]|jgi:hypothetical protein|nr:hypothetical protein [Candidatus Cybelea sp.]
MWHIARNSVTSAALLSALALPGCAEHAFATASTGSEFSAAVPLNTTYSFKVENDTDSEVTLQTFDTECMIKTLGGKIGAHKTQAADVETKTGQGCEGLKESTFTTSFSKSGRGDYVEYRFVKRTLSSWKIEHRHSGPNSTLSVDLTNGFADTRVKIYKLR